MNGSNAGYVTDCFGVNKTNHCRFLATGQEPFVISNLYQKGEKKI